MKVKRDYYKTIPIFNIELQLPDERTHLIRLLGKQFNYDNIINDLVTRMYPQDKMQAVVNNYLLDADDEDIKAEYQEMQAYRKWAKEQAKEILQYAEDNDLTVKFLTAEELKEMANKINLNPEDNGEEQVNE